MSIHYDQPRDPLEAAKEEGIANIAQFLANAQDPEKPWIIYGAGTVVDTSTVNPDTLAMWRATGRITVVAEVVDPTPPPTLPVISSVTATPDAADGTLASVTWDTDIAADSQVHYGPDTSYGTSSALDSTLTTGHGVSLTGLAAASEYHYSVASSGASSPDATFTTTT